MSRNDPADAGHRSAPVEFDGKVHSAAELFPMLPDDGLDELAADIRANGLLHPIVRQPDRTLLDGRNRLVACQRAGIAPCFEVHHGDPVTYVIAANVARRHMTKAQRAMAVATVAAIRRESQRSITSELGVSQFGLAKATVVLSHAPDLADGVLAGTVALDQAYAEARQRKQAATCADVQMAQLREQAPDLADLVEERLTLKEATAAARERAEEERQARVATYLLCEHLVVIAQIRDADMADRLDAEMVLPGPPVTRQVIADVKTALSRIEGTFRARDLR